MIHVESFLTKKIDHLPPISLPDHCRVLITGVTSIHGWPIYEQLRHMLPSSRLLAVRPEQMAVPAAPNVRPVCMTDRSALEKIKQDFNPTHIIHGAGVCDLDACEDNPQWAREINEGGTRTMLAVFQKYAHFLYLSTDLVYSGNHPPAGGYRETHEPDPVSVAAETFLAAEQLVATHERVTILRLGLPIGASLTGTKGALDFIACRFKRQLPMTLFFDEIRSCISCGDIAAMVIRLLMQPTYGLYHLGGKTGMSLYQLGESIIQQGGYPPELLKRLSRFQEKNGPPRIGDVRLNSNKLQQWFDQQVMVETTINSAV